MKTVEVGDLRLTEEMIAKILALQENDGEMIDTILAELNEAIKLIASTGGLIDYEKRALSAISVLCALRDLFYVFFRRGKACLIYGKGSCLQSDYLYIAGVLVHCK